MQPKLALAAGCLGLSLAITGYTTIARAESTSTVTACHDHAILSRALKERYSEEPVSIGLQSNGALMQVYASPQTGTWTITATRPDGMSCILAVGNNYEHHELGLGGPTARDDTVRRTDPTS
ncbi:MAG: hypothetical protein AAFX81_19905 [Pseudomonadota bacterium]